MFGPDLENMICNTSPFQGPQPGIAHVLEIIRYTQYYLNIYILGMEKIMIFIKEINKKNTYIKDKAALLVYQMLISKIHYLYIQRSEV